MALSDQARWLRAGSLAVLGLALCCVLVAVLSHGGTGNSLEVRTLIDTFFIHSTLELK